MADESLVVPEIVKRWDRAFASGSDKRYPSLDLVRLDLWWFKREPGRLLEYGFGSGVNTIHLLESGYTVDGLDASTEAKQVVERKIAARPDLAPRLVLKHLAGDATRLPYEDATFQHVVCVSVLSLLGSRARVERLLRELARVMKAGAKIILDVNGPRSDFARDGRPMGNEVYEYRGPAKNEDPVPCWCPASADRFVEVVRPVFKIEDVGFTAHRYLSSEIQEFIVLGRK